MWLYFPCSVTTRWHPSRCSFLPGRTSLWRNSSIEQHARTTSKLQNTRLLFLSRHKDLWTLLGMFAKQGVGIITPEFYTYVAIFSRQNGQKVTARLWKYQLCAFSPGFANDWVVVAIANRFGVCCYSTTQAELPFPVLSNATITLYTM